jgi:hypothetical protein
LVRLFKAKQNKMSGDKSEGGRSGDNAAVRPDTALTKNTSDRRSEDAMLQAQRQPADTINLSQTGPLRQAMATAINTRDYDKFKIALGYINNSNAAVLPLSDLAAGCSYSSDLPAPYSTMIEVTGAGLQGTGRDLTNVNLGVQTTIRYPVDVGKFFYENATRIISHIGGFDATGSEATIDLPIFSKALAMATAHHAVGNSGIYTMQLHDHVKRDSHTLGIKISNSENGDMMIPGSIPQSMRKDLLTSISDGKKYLHLCATSAAGNHAILNQIFTAHDNIGRRLSKDTTPSRKVVMQMVYDYLHCIVSMPARAGADLFGPYDSSLGEFDGQHEVFGGSSKRQRVDGLAQ